MGWVKYRPLLFVYAFVARYPSHIGVAVLSGIAGSYLTILMRQGV